MKELSNCCHAIVRIGGGDKWDRSDAQTCYYVCTQCNKACDLKPEKKNQCDGCQSGVPANENGNHLMPYPSGPMACEKEKYTEVN